MSLETFVYQNKNRKILKSSSSGGCFFAIASYVINNKGSVYGSILDENNGCVYHIRGTTIEDVRKMMGSKYVFSEIRDTFCQCKKDLIEDNLVLFVGTPCQINALHNFLGNCDKSKLLTLDFVCHGCPTQAYWKSYMDYIGAEAPYNFNFRNKKHGWEKYSFSYKHKCEEFKNNLYMKAFLDNQTLMPSCFNCNFKGNNRLSDITIGDAWGHSNYAYSPLNKKGLSLVVIRNQNDFFKEIFYKTGHLNKVLDIEAFQFNPSYYCSALKPGNYSLFNSWEYFNNIYHCRKDRKILLRFVYNLFKKIVNVFPIVTTKGKIGIISDFGYFNFGNKLQLFALQEVLKKYNCKSYLITKRVLRRINFFGKKKIYGCKEWTSRNDEIYKTSIKLHGQPLLFRPTRKNIKKINKSKALIFGSDQIWNYSYNFNSFTFFLGSFSGSKINIPKYSYAASAGVPTIKEKFYPYFMFYLSNFDSITVRETNLVNELKKIGIESHLVVDPTLLLSKDDWNAVITKFSKIKLPDFQYNFYYCLSDESFESNNQTINCLDKKSRYYAINQFDFINLIKNAKFVVTDSYHCIIFCIIFGIPFKFNERNDLSMNSRIETLSTIFNFDLNHNDYKTVSKYENNQKFNQLKIFSLNYLKRISDDK